MKTETDSFFHPSSLILHPFLRAISDIRQSFWQYSVFLLVLLLVSCPLFFLILGSFSTARLPTDFSLATMGWVNYLKVYTDPDTYALLGNTVIYVAGSAP